MQPGLHFSLPFADYMQIPAESKSSLDYLHSSPMEYRLHKDGKLETEQTPAMLCGSMLHGLALEGSVDWVTPPETYPSKDGDKPWTNAANFCKQWNADQTKPILSKSQDEDIRATAEAIRRDPFASTVLNNGNAEVSILSEYAGRLFKGRADWLSLDGGYVVDLKSTVDAGTDAFSRQLSAMRWHCQAALYLKLLWTLGYDSVRSFYFIAVEKVAPYRVNVRKLKDSALEIGLQEIEADLELLERCERDNCWPGLSGRGPSIQEIDLPAWKYADTAPLELTIGGKTFTT
jgi:hypothetical protein